MASLLCCASVVAWLLLLSTPLAASGTTPSLTLQLFNDSACTVPTTPYLDLNISVPIAAPSTSTCNAAPPVLLQQGFSWYEAYCGNVSNNNLVWVFLVIWQTSSDPTTGAPCWSANNSLFYSYSGDDTSITHNSSSCSAIRGALTNGTSSSVWNQYAQFSCGSIASPSNSAVEKSSMVDSTVYTMMSLVFAAVLFIA